VKAPYKPGTERPLARYQHSTLFIGTLMVVLGGRTNTVGENVQLEVYETESSEWKKFNSLQRFRHTVWTQESIIFCHGGFENDTPNIPTNSIMKLDLAALLKSTPAFLAKLE
jgi:protein phosphatase